MDLRQLKYLVTLAKERHFARAADICFVTQPTLSARIRQLEDEFGVPLVVRDHRFRGLTRFGDRVVEWATSVLDDCDALKQDFNRIRQAGEGAISVGIVPSASPLASLLLSFFRFQDIPVTADVQTLTAADVARRVAQGNLNLGISYISDADEQSLKAFPLAPETYVAIRYGKVQSSTPTQWSWEDLEGRDLCLPTKDVPGRAIIDSCLAAESGEYNTTIETDCWLTMLQAVRRNGLVGIAPSHVVGILTIPTGTQVIPLPAPPAPLELAILAGDAPTEEPALVKVMSALSDFKEFFESESTAFKDMEEV